MNTSPNPAPITHNGVENSLEEAKAAFRRRYLEVKDTHYR
jgi:hypothetical protein